MRWSRGWDKRLKRKWRSLDRRTRRLYRRILNGYLGWHERWSYEAETTAAHNAYLESVGAPPIDWLRPMWAGIREAFPHCGFGPPTHRRKYRRDR